MTQGPDEFSIDFPALVVALYWIEAHCVIPDGLRSGELIELVGWQQWCMANAFRVRPEAKHGQLAPAFHWRRSQVVLPQKAGKAPYTACRICVEADGPAVFDGWAVGGEVYSCHSEHGCGFVYEYEPGEAMGRKWPNPLIQITATSEEQTDNIYDALRPMIDNGPLHESIPKTGEEFIRTPTGRIDTVTSNARSRLGQRLTFAPQDETGIWTPETRMVKVAETQRRGLAGMGGRAEETTNGWDSSQGSVAQRTAESKATDIFRHHPLAPEGLDYADPEERRKIHEVVYAGSWWVDQDAIEAEAAELITVDLAQAERFFGNRVTYGAGKAYDPDKWDSLADATAVIPDQELIVIGVDGARYDDALAVIATDVVTGHQWKLGIWEVPENAPDDYEHDIAEGGEVDGVMSEAFDRWQVWRVYIDPQRIEGLVNVWQGRWGDKIVMEWRTNRPRQMAHAVRFHVTAVNKADLSHDGDTTFSEQIKNACKQPVSVNDENGRQMYVLGKDRPYSPLKMDAGPAAVLSWWCRGDAIAEGAKARRKTRAYGF